MGPRGSEISRNLPPPVGQNAAIRRLAIMGNFGLAQAGLPELPLTPVKRFPRRLIGAASLAGTVEKELPERDSIISGSTRRVEEVEED